MKSKNRFYILLGAITLCAAATLSANAAVDVSASNFTPAVKTGSVVFGNVEVPPIPESFLSSVPGKVMPQLVTVAAPEPGTLVAGLAVLGYGVIRTVRRNRA